jgi:hypothetical protein
MVSMDREIGIGSKSETSAIGLEETRIIIVTGSVPSKVD